LTTENNFDAEEKSVLKGVWLMHRIKVLFGLLLEAVEETFLPVSRIYNTHPHEELPHNKKPVPKLEVV
jgi:hypothetical protein